METQKNGPKEAKGGDNLIVVKVIVNGKAYNITVNKNEKIASLIKEALKESDSDGRKESDWRLKLGDQVLNPDNKIKDYPIHDESELFLSLDAGHGGDLCKRH